jgi:hypothetical protein
MRTGAHVERTYLFTLELYYYNIIPTIVNADVLGVVYTVQCVRLQKHHWSPAAAYVCG